MNINIWQGYMGFVWYDDNTMVLRWVLGLVNKLDYNLLGTFQFYLINKIRHEVLLFIILNEFAVKLVFYVKLMEKIFSKFIYILCIYLIL